MKLWRMLEVEIYIYVYIHIWDVLTQAGWPCPITRRSCFQRKTTGSPAILFEMTTGKGLRGDADSSTTYMWISGSIAIDIKSAEGVKASGCWVFKLIGFRFSCCMDFCHTYFSKNVRCVRFCSFIAWNLMLMFLDVQLDRALEGSQAPCIESGRVLGAFPSWGKLLRKMNHQCLLVMWRMEKWWLI